MSRRNAEGAASGATTAAVFGEVLRHFREAAGLTQAELARRVHCDRSHVARVEAGTRVPQDTFAKACDELLGTGGVLLRLWRRIDWYPQVEHPDWFERRARMDAEAVVVRAYQTQVIPGLLQTPEYATALFGRRLAQPDDVEDRVSARLSRQRRFLEKGGPFYLAVLDESCLRHVVGGPDVMRGQCEHLLAVGRLPNIRIQIAPLGWADIDRPDTSLSLIELPGGQRWVYSESLDRGHFSDDPAVFMHHTRTYDVLRADVLSAPESASLIRDVLEGYEADDQPSAPHRDVDQEQLQRRQRRRLRRGGPRIYGRRPRP
ncbi:helix-turn-helix domain-containing protein [Streptomyces sp. ISL-12]|uniref:helix-turn-helix domain-containing protein n=1 Tax=Streptomyces sp. ISL-12 TaxID=2819177 RepID=UPI001BEBF9A0|nr:helix-turn-helix transcriptional regulator [Streptomyces sp. ISL-12]MBT2409752.1 helix-turn-helix domain-containing protein [Streptomyces sp. ISL-12]